MVSPRVVLMDVGVDVVYVGVVSYVSGAAVVSSVRVGGEPGGEVWSFGGSNIALLSSV